MSKSIHHTLFYPQKAALVWEYLTTPALMAQWLMPTDFEPILGHEFQFRTNPIPKFEFDGIVNCKVLEILTNLDIFKGMDAGWLANMKKIADRLNATAHGHANV